MRRSSASGASRRGAGREDAARHRHEHRGEGDGAAHAGDEREVLQDLRACAGACRRPRRRSPSRAARSRRGRGRVERPAPDGPTASTATRSSCSTSPAATAGASARLTAEALQPGAAMRFGGRELGAQLAGRGQQLGDAVGPRAVPVPRVERVPVVLARQPVVRTGVDHEHVVGQLRRDRAGLPVRQRQEHDVVARRAPPASSAGTPGRRRSGDAAARRRPCGRRSTARSP